METIQIKKILVPIDGSEHAYKALNYAIDMASKYHADLHILTSYTLDEDTFTLIQRATPRSLIESYRDELKGLNEQILKRAVNQAKQKNPTLNIFSILVRGRPAEKIVEAAKKGQFDLIVMGSRGLGGIKGLLLGSVADRVADNAVCPVMLVK